MKIFSKILKIIFIFVIFIALVTGIIIGAKGYLMYSKAIAHESVASRVERIEKQPNYTKFEELPETYVKAIIAVEDPRFYTHGGVDFRSTLKAAWTDLTNGKILEGGSTITQQLSRIMYFSQEKKFARKVAEILIARDVEKLCSKEKILELYVNRIYFGSGYYNVREAAKGYFNKEPSQMNDYEATMLAGIPNAPSAYSPDVSPKLAEERRQQVIRKMEETGAIHKGDIE